MKIISGRGGRIRTRTSRFGGDFLRFWGPLCYHYTTPLYLRLTPISFAFSLFIFTFSFKRHSTLIITILNRIIFIYSIFFSFVKFLQAAILYDISSKAAARFVSIALHFLIRMMPRFKCGVMLMSTFIHILALSYIDFTITVVSYFIYSNW